MNHSQGKSYSCSQQTHMLNLYLISMWKETLIFALSLESVPYFHPPHRQPSTGFHLFFPSPKFISRTHKSSFLKSSGVMLLSLTRATKPGFYPQACPPPFGVAFKATFNPPSFSATCLFVYHSPPCLFYYTFHHSSTVPCACLPLVKGIALNGKDFPSTSP